MDPPRVFGCERVDEVFLERPRAPLVEPLSDAPALSFAGFFDGLVCLFCPRLLALPLALVVAFLWEAPWVFFEFVAGGCFELGPLFWFFD